MYVIVTGAGKVGENITRALVRRGYEVTLIESRRDRVQRLEEEFDYRVHLGDATELYVLERAGIQRPPDLVLAVTGDDEDNIVICQLAREKYGVPKVIARVNDPRNQAHFDLLGIAPTVCATSDIMAKVEHEMPGFADVIHLLELRQENLEIIEVEIDERSPAAGKTIERLDLPSDARLILVSRNGRAEIAIGATTLQPGDRVMAILQTGKEDEVRDVLLSAKSR
jgi:trk system potassium uptake protein TrkA